VAGAAQAIGWILQVDDQVSGVLDNVATKAVQMGQAIAKSVRVRLTPSFEKMSNKFSEMTDQVGDLFSIEAIETVVDMLRPLFVDLQETIAKLRPVVQEVQEATEEASLWGGRLMGPINRFFFRWGLFIAGWKKIIGGIRWFVGIPLRLLKGVLGTITSLLSPITTIIKAPFFKLFQDLMDAIDFALKPIFMQMRILLIPFIVVFMPMLTRLVTGLMRNYVLPFVIEWLPKITKGFETIWIALFGRKEEAKTAWEDIKTWAATSWDSFKGKIGAGWDWFKTTGMTQLETWADSVLYWAEREAMPTVAKTVSGWFSGDTAGAPAGGIMGEIFSVIGRLFLVFVKGVGALLAPLGVAIMEFAKGITPVIGNWVRDKIADFGVWIRDTAWPQGSAWLLRKISELWKAVGDEAVKILPEGAATLLGFKKAESGSVGGLTSSAAGRMKLVKQAMRLRKKEKAGTLDPFERNMLRSMRGMDIPGLQHGGVITGTPEGRLAVIGEGGTTEGVIPFGKDVPHSEAVRMMQSAVTAAAMAKGGAPSAGGGDAVSVLKAIENTLLLIADNTEDQSWMNDPDFDQSKSRKPWQT